MEANELSCKDIMVGDWVIPHVFDSTLKPSKIVGIHYNSYKGKDYVDWVDCEVWDELSMNDIEPIPLTPEILKKNGFTLEHHSGDVMTGYWWTRNDFVIHNSMNDAIGRNNFKYEYVHQLQHALRLCGIGKEIEL